MAWIDYYNLLVKYKGDLSKATHLEILEVIIKNNFNPDEAIKKAKAVYYEERKGIVCQ